MHSVASLTYYQKRFIEKLTNGQVPLVYTDMAVCDSYRIFRTISRGLQSPVHSPLRLTVHNDSEIEGSKNLK